MRRAVVRRPFHSFPTRRSSDLEEGDPLAIRRPDGVGLVLQSSGQRMVVGAVGVDDVDVPAVGVGADVGDLDRKSTRLNSSHLVISYAVFCLKIQSIAVSDRQKM